MSLTDTETPWSGGGGEPSLYESEPSIKPSFGISGESRVTPDVAFDANPATGVAIYDA